MQITRFSRIDTVMWPGKYLSVVEVSADDGETENINEVANIIRGDSDSIDAILVQASKGDAASIPGIHTLIREIRPPHMSVILVTDGRNPSGMDDLIGASYVDHVAFRFEDVPNADQQRSIAIARINRVDFFAGVLMDPGTMPPEKVLKIAEMTEGHMEFILLLPPAPLACYRKKDLNALAKSLKGKAKGVRVLEDFRRPSSRGRRPGSATCCSRSRT